MPKELGESQLHLGFCEAVELSQSLVIIGIRMIWEVLT